MNGNAIVKAAAQNLVAQLKQLNSIPFGLTDAKIVALTASGTGTVAKLKTAIAALAVRNIHTHYRDNIVAAINRANRYGILIDADVETAASAGSDNFEALLTAIKAHTQAAAINITDAQAYAVWAQ